MAEHANVYPLRREPQREPQPGPRPQEPLWREVLGRRLRALRQEQQETLSETAARAGISPQYLSEIERGRKEPSSEMIAAVSGALGVALDDLLIGIAGDVRRRRLADLAGRRRRRPTGPVLLAA